MASLKDSWQAQRHQRQQALIQRQQQVHETLTSFQQERQIKASLLRDDLLLFQLQLQQETQVFLAQANAQRHADAEQLTQHLHNSTQRLREQTAQFLSMTAIDRSLMAQQIRQELNEFHVNLSSSVASLRQTLQAKMQQIRLEVNVLQMDTQEQLYANQQERIAQQAQLRQDLTAYVEMLQSGVQTYLTELELARHDRAQQLQQMLQQSHDRRIANNDALFQNLSTFRAELQAYRAELRQMVWGEPDTSTAPTDDRTSAPMTAPQKPPPTARRASTATPKRATAKSRTPSHPAASVSQPVSAPAAPPAPSAAIPSDLPTLEQDVYRHIDQHQGARLTEIESALNINRFQAVDALRSLIRNGLITQRDRIYLIQEDVSS